MSSHYARTAAGQAEIQSRALGLSRPIRNLLLILNPSQPAEFWLAQVKGCEAGDLARLLNQGLIAPAPAPTPPVVVDSAEHDFLALRQQVLGLPHDALYDLLNAVSKEVLGLVRGYRLALDVERCAGPEALRALALRLLDQMRDEMGSEALRRFDALLDRR